MAENIIKLPKNLTGKTIVTPEGKIRNGNRRPLKKATLKEQAVIIDFVADLLVKQAYKTQIHRAVEEQFKKSGSIVDRIYVPRARTLLKQQASITSEQAKEIGVTVLLDVLRSEKGNVRVNAEARLAEIFGYNSAKRTELSGVDGKPIAGMVIQIVGAPAPAAKVSDRPVQEITVHVEPKKVGETPAKT